MELFDPPLRILRVSGLDRREFTVYTFGNTMAKNLSLKMREDIFREMETTVRRLKKPRNAYINEAVEHFNRLHRRRVLAEEFARASAAVQEESMRVLKEFEAIDEVPE